MPHKLSVNEDQKCETIGVQILGFIYMQLLKIGFEINVSI